MAYQNYPYQQYPQMYNPQFVQQQMPQQMQQQVPQQMQQMAQQMQMTQQQVPQQMQSGGFISAPNEAFARNYPVAPGNVMTFKIENQPIVCEKAQGFSQLEGPVFNKYRLVKEEELVEEKEAVEAPVNNNDDLREEIEYLKKELKELKEKVYAKPKPLPRNTDNNNKGGHRE